MKPASGVVREEIGTGQDCRMAEIAGLSSSDSCTCSAKRSVFRCSPMWLGFACNGRAARSREVPALRRRRIVLALRVPHTCRARSRCAAGWDDSRRACSTPASSSDCISFFCLSKNAARRFGVGDWTSRPAPLGDRGFTRAWRIVALGFLPSFSVLDGKRRQNPQLV